jgi:hypothetical protein
MCDTVYSSRESLARGEASTVFAHSVACRTCRNALLVERAYPPGCADPQTGYQVTVHLDAIVDGGAVDASLLEHVDECGACAIEVAEARAALRELSAAGRRSLDPHSHPRLPFPRWLIGGLLLVMGATASETPPNRLLALREVPLGALATVGS